MQTLGRRKQQRHRFAAAVSVKRGPGSQPLRAGSLELTDESCLGEREQLQSGVGRAGLVLGLCRRQGALRLACRVEGQGSGAF